MELLEKRNDMCGSIAARPTVFALAAAALLSGCAGSSPVITPQSAIETSRVLATAAFNPDAQHFGNDYRFIYTAQFYGNDLGVYKRSGSSLTPYETLTQGISAPQGTVTTVNGWWYVANGGDSNVLVYRTKKHGPTSSPVATLEDYGQDPVNVDVTPSRQLVAVSNSGSSSATGSVGIYLHRQTKPSRILTYGSDPLAGMGVAIDHQGNCYWSFNDPKTGSGSVVEFARCNGTGTLIVSGIPNAGGIVLDQSGDLYYVNQTTNRGFYSGIYQCKKTSHCSFFVGGFGQPTNINFDYKQKALWVADASGYIDAVDLKTGYVTKIQSAYGDPFGVAPEPGN